MVQQATGSRLPSPSRLRRIHYMGNARRADIYDMMWTGVTKHIPQKSKKAPTTFLSPVHAHDKLTRVLPWTFFLEKKDQKQLGNICRKGCLLSFIILVPRMTYTSKGNIMKKEEELNGISFVNGSRKSVKQCQFRIMFWLVGDCEKGICIVSATYIWLVHTHTSLKQEKGWRE